MCGQRAPPERERRGVGYVLGGHRHGQAQCVWGGAVSAPAVRACARLPVSTQHVPAPISLPHRMSVSSLQGRGGGGREGGA